jgi:hypothetical protein
MIAGFFLLENRELTRFLSDLPVFTARKPITVIVAPHPVSPQSKPLRDHKDRKDQDPSVSTAQQMSLMALK